MSILARCASGLLLALATPMAAWAQAAPVATIETGPLRGAAADGIAIFRGIPYAAPPVGDLRWRAPQPAARWTEPRDATRFAATACRTGCPATSRTAASRRARTASTLNVWTPRPGKQAKGLPVMVWIYGGGFVNGSGAAPAL